MTYAWIALLLTLDQACKIGLTGHDITMIPQIFSLSYMINDGAAFSILPGKKYFLILVGLFSLVLIHYYFQKKNEKKLNTWAHILLTAGVTGNLIDRILLGGVRDFIAILSFPVFNLADCYIVIGVLFVIILIGKEEYHAKNNGTRK